MTFISSVLFKLAILSLSYRTYLTEILRTDCYEALSFPNQYIKLAHYFPTGPLYLFITFRYSLYSFIFGYISKNGKIDYAFKRIDNSCTCSIYFTSIGKDFNKLDIKVAIRLLNNDRIIAFFEYTFYKGFSPGLYKLNDDNKNFALHVNIMDIMNEYMWTPLRSLNESILYLSSLSGKNEELCVITYNNREVVLTPDYGNYSPSGVVTSFIADIFIEDKYYGIKEYSAFHCHKNNSYPNNNVILIVDGKEVNLNFKAVYWTFYPGFSTFDEYEFLLHNMPYGYVEYWNHYSKNYNKLFMVKDCINITNSQDSSPPMYYLSRNNKIYYGILFKKNKISSSVECTERITICPP